MRWIILAVPVTLFAGSCFMVAGYGHGGFLEDGYEPIGWQLLVYGWGWFVFGLAGVVWLPNPLFIAGLGSAAARDYTAAAFFTGLAVACALIPFAWFASAAHDVRLERPFALVAAGGRLELRLGYFVWLASHATLFAVSIGFVCLEHLCDALQQWLGNRWATS